MIHESTGVDWSQLQPGSLLLGVDAHAPVEVIASSPVPGTNSYNVVYRRGDGTTAIFVVDDKTQNVSLLDSDRRWTFDADPALFRLVTEAQRIRLAHLFDPLLAVHTSLVEPLPHQITAVYHELLTRQPLRFILADDPGAGKTIMTGLFIRELMARGDLQRCLIVAPCSLVAVHVPWGIEQGRFTTSENQLYVSAGFLQTRYGTPIYLAFERNTFSNPPWYLKAARPDMAAAELPIPPDFPASPKVPVGAEIIMAHDHILGENANRVAFLRNTPAVAQVCAIAGAIQWSINRGLQLPHWYFGRMNYVVPVYLQSLEDITQMPDLVAPVQANPNSLLVRTVLVPHMIYANCRVAVERQNRLPPWLLDTWGQHADIEQVESEMSVPT